MLVERDMSCTGERIEIGKSIVVTLYYRLMGPKSS